MSALLAPVLGLAGVRRALAARRGPTVAPSPVVEGRPLVTGRDRHRAAARAALMACQGLAHTPGDYARWIVPLASHVVLDPADANWAPHVSRSGVAVVSGPVIGNDPYERSMMVDVVLDVSDHLSIRRPVRG